MLFWLGLIVLILFFSTPVFASICTYDVNGDGKIDPETEYFTCSHGGQLCPYDAVPCDPVEITIIPKTIFIRPTNVTDRSGVTRIQAGSGATGLDFYGWQYVNDGCSPVYMGDIRFNGTRIEGVVSAQRITRLVGNYDKIEVYGCNGKDCTEEALQGSIVISGASITGSAEASEGFLAVGVSGKNLVFTGLECSYGYCEEKPAGSLHITGSTLSHCPYGEQYLCYGGACSKLNCIDETLNELISMGTIICASDLDKDGGLDFSENTDEIYICDEVEVKEEGAEAKTELYCGLEVKPCERDLLSPCPEGGTYLYDEHKCRSERIRVCPGGYTYNGWICQSNPVCLCGDYNSSAERCESNTVDSHTKLTNMFSLN